MDSFDFTAQNQLRTSTDLIYRNTTMTDDIDARVDNRMIS